MTFNKKLSKIIFASVIAFLAASAHADVTHAAFDRNNIIDNSIFDNSQTMSTEDIQRFLNGFPSSCLKNYTAPYPIDYSNYGSPTSAATVIRRVADLWRMNPQVVLATLEKEQSLVSGGAGCPEWRYNSAMGMGCPDNGPCPAPSYAGFSRQVTKGSWQLMFNRQRSEGNIGWNGDGSVGYYSFMTAGYRARVQGGSTSYYDGYATIDGQQVYMSNGATASLYSYTPHFHGNQNFVLIFERWFGPTHGTFLLQGPSGPTVYLQSGTTRYSVPSMDVLYAYGYGHTKVTPVSDQYLQSLTDGGTLSTTFKLEGSGSIYLADNGYRLGFATYDQCVDWGVPDCLNSKSLSPILFNMVRNGGDMKPLMANGSSIFLMDDGKKRVFLSGTALTESGYNFSNAVPITNPLNLRQPPGFAIPENNSLVSFNSTPTIYLYANGGFYEITSYDIFKTLLSDQTKVYKDGYSLYNSQLPPTQSLIPAHVRLSSTGASYLLSDGKKYDITADTGNWPAATTLDALTTVLNRKPTYAAVKPTSTFRTPAGYLFKVTNKKVVPFYGLSDYFSSSYDKQPIHLIQGAISTLPIDTPIIIPGNGSLFKVTTGGKQDAIYTLNTNGTSCALTSVNQLGDFKFDTSNVQRIAEFASDGGSLKGLVTSNDGQAYITHASTKTPVSSTTLASWGATTSGACSFSNDFFARVPSSQTQKTGTFARLPNGAIYYANNNQMHLVQSYSTFLSLGGNASNTLDVSADFLSYVTVGSPLN